MKCFYCSSEDCTAWTLEFSAVESNGRSMYSRQCNECHQIMHMAGLFHSEGSKRDYYAERDKMNIEDMKFCRSMGIIL